MLDAVWLIPALPLFGFVVLLAVGKRMGEPVAGWFATTMVSGSFVAGVVTFAGLMAEDEHGRTVTKTLFTWIPSGRFSVDIAALIDPLSMTMVLFVTGVGALIHLYSVGYMHGDEGFHRFFVYLNLFVFSMLVLVLGASLLLTFLGWEGVGVCSYFLISFWFTRDSARVAGKKAFITNRVGDWGFMLAMFLVFTSIGSLTYTEWLPQVGGLSQTTATAVALLLFVGAVGKSAQLPLYVWLPDAMEGPTPVSALIHAATMVTSGVYLMARVNPLLDLAPDALTVIAVVGALTALFAATVAVAQHDIKKVLAYSTVSQLGYMFLAIGSGAYVAAIFHMVTHAFFKALLFLGAGAVIHGVNDEQDMRRMGGLRKYMPVTAFTFIVGWLAIAGIPPFSGFWSKDEILINAWDKNIGLWLIGVVTAVLTAYYMTRQVILVFFSEERFATEPATAVAESAEGDGGDTEPAADAGHRTGEPHEAPWTMTAPLLALAGLSLVGGAINLPFKGALHLEEWLHPVFGERLHHLEAANSLKWGLPPVIAALAVVGGLVAYAVFQRRRIEASVVEPVFLEHAWYVDEGLSAAVAGPGRELATLLADTVDAKGVDGAVNGVGALVQRAGGGLRTLQTGLVRNYALGIAGGVVAVLAFFLARSGL